MRRPTRFLSALAAAAVTLLLATGCSPNAGSSPQPSASNSSAVTADPNQSAMAACLEIESEMTAVNDQVVEAQNLVTSGDLQGAVNVFNTIGAEIVSITQGISNPEVKAAFEEFGAAITDFGGLLSGLTDNLTDANKQAELLASLEKAATRLEAAALEIQTVCG